MKPHSIAALSAVFLLSACSFPKSAQQLRLDGNGYQTTCSEKDPRELFKFMARKFKACYPNMAARDPLGSLITKIHTRQLDSGKYLVANEQIARWNSYFMLSVEIGPEGQCPAKVEVFSMYDNFMTKEANHIIIDWINGENLDECPYK